MFPAFRSSLFVLGLSLSPAVSALCSHGTTFFPRAEGSEEVHVSDFAHVGPRGPLNWAALDPANFHCRNGTRQTPTVVDHTTATLLNAYSDLFVDILPVGVEGAEFENIGSTVEVVLPDHGTTRYNGKEYSLRQFHLHTPSEHHLFGEYYPLELHMVHQAADDSLLVLGILFQISSTSTTSIFPSLTKNLDAIATPGTRTHTGALDFTPLVSAFNHRAYPHSHTHAHGDEVPIFTYSGSLTTPPCSEDVTWLVRGAPLPIDVESFNALKKVMRFNARYTQNTPGEQNLLEMAVDTAVKADGIDSYKFTCAGSGLRYEAQERVATDTLRELLLPTGKEAITDRGRPKSWWAAQTVFYGLEFGKTMSVKTMRAQLENALRDNGNALEVPAPILELEEKSDEEFRALNAQARRDGTTAPSLEEEPKTRTRGGGKRSHGAYAESEDDEDAEDYDEPARKRKASIATPAKRQGRVSRRVQPTVPGRYILHDDQAGVMALVDIKEGQTPPQGTVPVDLYDGTDTTRPKKSRATTSKRRSAPAHTPIPGRYVLHDDECGAIAFMDVREGDMPPEGAVPLHAYDGTDTTKIRMAPGPARTA
ncbi:Carbonic anhydrase [Mycena kentingensis (nom. inval.)]|nr:Carbonic anhydrase [Mycena kentingensis (nom. inval.)]